MPRWVQNAIKVLLFLGIAFPLISSAEGCLSLLSEDPTEFLRRQYRERYFDYINGEENLNSWLRYKQNFETKLAAQLDASGLKFKKVNSQSLTYFLILSEGPHFLNRLAQKLSPKGIELRVDHESWLRGAASTGSNYVNVDASSVSATNKLTPILTHELRHLINQDRALLQITIEAPLTRAGIGLPGMDQNSGYSQRLPLDEILAFHQSASRTLRALRLSIQNDDFRTPHRRNFEVQMRLISQMLHSWSLIQNASLAEIKNKDFGLELNDQELSLSLNSSGLIFKFPRFNKVQRPMVITKDWAADVALNHIYRTDQTLRILKAPVAEVLDRLESFDGLDMTETQAAFDQLTRLIRTLNL